MEEGATNEDLDLDEDDDNNDAMDVASNKDNAIIYVTAGGILPPTHPHAVVGMRLLSRDKDPPLLLLPL